MFSALLLPLLMAQPAAKVPMALEPFDLREVVLGDGPCRVAQDANRRYLLSIPNDRLLWTFRQNAGLPTPGRPLGGWEAPDCEIRGHFVGHYLSACALLYRGTGDAAIKAKSGELVAELAKVQAKLGDGYLSAYPASFIDRLERMERVTWAPLYVTHKIMAGLLDMQQLAGNQQALEVLTALVGWYQRRAEKLSDYQFERLLTVEFGGMSEVLHNLYGVTRSPDHLALAHRYDQAAFLGPLALERDNLAHLHGNTQIPKVCGAARRYELTGDARYRTMVRFFWDRVVQTRTYATGGTTLAEVWPEPNRLASTLGVNNQECCKTHNLLKVTRYLLRWTGEPAYGDYYERAFYNGILGTQRADSGQFIYYVPLATGSRKAWGTPFDSFWCCYGTGVESFAKLADSVFFHDRDGLCVNLFVPATVTWTERGVKLEQRTRFPAEESTCLVWHVDQPTRLKLRVRVPYWAAHGVTVQVNRRPVRVSAKPGSWLVLDREWHDGDRIDIALPMALHAAPMSDDPESVAVMYGPSVLLGLDPKAGGYVIGDPARPADWVQREPAAPGRWRLKQHQGEVTLVPFDQVIDERYGVYWTVTREGSRRHQALLAEERARQARRARVVDEVTIGDAASERAHGLRGERMGDGPYADRHWRHAPDGWFSWDLKVLGDQPMTLVCTYWGSDVPPRQFDILVDGTKVGSMSLNQNRPGEFFDVEYPLPRELTRDKRSVTVRFQAAKGNTAGGVFGVAMLR